MCTAVKCSTMTEDKVGLSGEWERQTKFEQTEQMWNSNRQVMKLEQITWCEKITDKYETSSDIIETITDKYET